MKVKVWQKGAACLLTALLVLEIFLLFGFLASRKDALRYAMEYEKSQVEIESVTVRNIDDRREDYEVYDGRRLYEVSMTCHNRAAYASQLYRGIVKFEEKGSGNAAYSVYGKDLGYLGSVAYDSQMLPAGQTGTYRWVIAVDEQEDALLIRDIQDRFAGENVLVQVDLPEEAGESVTKQLE